MYFVEAMHINLNKFQFYLKKQNYCRLSILCHCWCECSLNFTDISIVCYSAYLFCLWNSRNKILFTSHFIDKQMNRLRPTLNNLLMSLKVWLKAQTLPLAAYVNLVPIIVCACAACAETQKWPILSWIMILWSLTNANVSVRSLLANLA